jgi:CRP-like cAMP-binding protein
MAIDTNVLARAYELIHGADPDLKLNKAEIARALNIPYISMIKQMRRYERHGIPQTRKVSKRQAILNLLLIAGDSSQRDIMDSVNGDYESIRRLLLSMRKEGAITRNRGRRSKTERNTYFIYSIKSR